MKNKNRMTKMLAVLLVMMLTLQNVFPVLADENTANKISIGTVEEFQDFAKKCALDTWSQEKVVVLENDISFSGVEFETIPTFGGTFDGNGHKITEVQISESYAPSGIFAVLQEGGQIKNLHVSASVIPSGEKSMTGGIVGENYGTITGCSFSGVVKGEENSGGIAGYNGFTGTIKGCTSSGAVMGDSRTGGIAGYNLGMIQDCTNTSKVNNVSSDPSVNLDALSAIYSMSLSGLASYEVVEVASDSGGIAGYSSGMIVGCKNTATVGYEHIGYNIGGIVGRSSGHLSNNSNTGDIFGRKEVGGIAGQIEPQISLGLSSDYLASLRTQLKKMESLINQTADAAESSGNAIADRIDSMNQIAGSAYDSSNALASQLESYGKESVSQMNRALELVESTISFIDDIMDDISSASQEWKQGTDELERAIEQLIESGMIPEESQTSLQNSLKQLKEAKDSRDQGVEKIKSGINGLKQIVKQETEDNILEAAKTSFNQIKEGTSLILNAVKNTRTALKQLKTTLNGLIEDLPDVTEDTKEQIKNIESLISNMENPLDTMENIAEKVENQIEYLEEVDSVQISLPDETVTGTARELSGYVGQMEEEISLLNASVRDTVNGFAGNIRAINEQFSIIADTLLNVIYQSDSSESEIIEDASDEDIAKVTTGKTIGCTNEGNVTGDINVGGITGAIAIEYELDPEDDLSADISVTQRKTYQLKAILQNCTNTGDVTAKKDGAGSICGKMDLGLIIGCNGYGAIESESGDYVGGIAGLAGGSIRDCYSKATLKGTNYVGGIIGNGIEEESLGSSCQVTGCYSMVEIVECTQYGGAIAGDNKGTFKNNYFVSDEYAGINRVSYTGKAEPISYDTFQKNEDAPTEFRKFTLTFVADEEIIKKQTFTYGDSFDETVFPEIPEKEGKYGEWDRTDLTNLCFDTVVTAVYSDYVTALSGQQKREDDRNVFLAEGNFTSEDEFEVTEVKEGKAKFSFWKGKNVEQFVLTIPADNLESNQIRYLVPEGDAEDYKIYIKSGDKWEKAETKVIGSYLAFEVIEDEVEIAVLKKGIF